MGAIASRSLQTTRKSHGWAAWLILALPLIGIGGFLYASTQRVAKPTISLFDAVEKDDQKALHAHALSGTNLNQLDDQGHTALYRAIDTENDAAATLLLKDGANPNAERAELETPLMLAASQGDYRMVDLLLHKGASTYAGPRDGLSALYEGSRSGNPQVVALLLKAGAEPNASWGVTGATPLSVAAWQGNLPIVDLLINAGADTSLGAYQGLTPSTSREAEDTNELSIACSKPGQRVASDMLSRAKTPARSPASQDSFTACLVFGANASTRHRALSCCRDLHRVARQRA